MKSILYATDYSESSIAALKYAHQMSVGLNAKLWVIHVFESPSAMQTRARIPFPNREQDTYEKHNEKLEAFCKEHLGGNLETNNISVEAIMDKSAVDGIISKAEELQSLLIITGMNSTSTLRRLIMGSTARGLVEKAPYPVLTIPEDSTYTPIKTIVYASDFQQEDLDALCKLATIAKPLEAKIKVVHICPSEKTVFDVEQTERKEKIDKHVKYDNVALEILYSDDIFNELKTYYKKTNADIIGMLERENTSLAADLFYRNLLKKMKSYGKIPIMSFNAKNYGKFHL
ncbi:universal stress protein [Gelidibacter maritimus]|uniref:Universal stress protein n=1 Tax=Gelidibacter maritimus TaxID=2761487 RepID=A0A7W2M2A0_9FLAO|nr:universal stress protein [Gelidibacter maritimus]MBA6151404.1 universal stress protein [Gelidibacter maritimus]